MRLFVDVDQTLLRYSVPVSPGELARLNGVNHHVVDWVKRWIEEHPGGVTTVWSDSGRDWARNRGVQALGVGYWCAEVKDFSQLRTGDVVIDDQPVPSLPVGAVLWHPDELR